MPIHFERVENLHLSQDIVVDVDVTDKVLSGCGALVESRAVYDAMQELSASLLGALNLDPVKNVKMLDFSELPAIQVEGVPATRRLVSADGSDISTVYQVPGYGAGSQYFRIPSIVKLNNDRRVAVFDVRWQSTADIGKTQYNDQCIGMSYSDDRGKTWSSPKAIIDWFYPTYDPARPGASYQCGASDPGILYDEENDVIMVFAIAGVGTGVGGRHSQRTEDVLAAERQQLAFTYSKDGGETWSRPATVNDKIFDADGMGRTWARQYAYLYPMCNSGITLRRQNDPSNNGMILPVQVHPTGYVGSGDWEKNFRSGILKVRPVYDEDRNIADIALTFAGIDGVNTLFGEECNGSSEGSVCEGPNGEIAVATRAYRSVSNSISGTYSNSGISIRVSKADGLGRPWSLVGDLPYGESDKVCTSLETAGQTKPGLTWSPKLNMYVIGYLQILTGARKDLVLRCSSDLQNWNFLTALEIKENMGYVTLVPQEDPGKAVECVYEAWNDGVSAGTTKQLKYFSLAADGNLQCRFSSASVDHAAVASSSASVKGFSFNLSEAVSTGPLSPTPVVARPVNAVRIQWGAFSVSQNDIYIVVYDADSDEGNAIAYSDVVNLSSSSGNPDFFVTFRLKQAINIDTAHEYFVQFKRNSATPCPESLDSIPKRGALGSGGNVVIPTVFCSRYQTADYMKVYQNAQAQYTNSHPWFVYMDLLS